MNQLGHVASAVARAANANGLQRSEGLMLLVIHELGGETTTAELYNVLGTETSAVRRTTYALERRRLLTRRDGDGGKPRRASTVGLKLTAAGARKAEAIATTTRRHMEAKP